MKLLLRRTCVLQQFNAALVCHAELVSASFSIWRRMLTFVSMTMEVMLNNDQNVQVSDTTTADSSNIADYIII